MLDNIAFFEGKFIPFKDAKISIMTHAFLYGTSVFEGIRAYWNEKKKKFYLFRALEHFERFKNSTKILRMNLKYNTKELVDLSCELIKKNSYKEDIYIRPTAYKSSLKIGPSLINTEDDFCMFTMPMGDYIDTKKGIAVCTSSWQRVEDNSIPARAKISGSYINTALAKAEAQLNNFADCLMLDDRGHICEGSAMNFFMIKNNKLITSPIYSDLLEGVTRDSIIKIAKQELNLEVVEREIDRSEAFLADELFFCGTGAQVSPISSVDHYIVGNGAIGEITAKLQEIYFAIVKGENPKYSNWYIEI